MVSPTLNDYFFGYWLYLKKHPELTGRQFTNFVEFMESGIYAINTCIGLDGPMCESLEMTGIHCSISYNPSVCMNVWNALIDNFTILDSAFVSYFRTRMYELDEVASGREECKILHTSIEEITKVSNFMHELNDELFQFQPLSEKEYDDHCYIYSRFTDLINKLVEDCQNKAQSRRRY